MFQESRAELPPYAVAKMDERLADKEALKVNIVHYIVLKHLVIWSEFII